MIFPLDHPFHPVLGFVANIARLHSLEFGVYRYHPRTVSDRRYIEQVPIERAAARAVELADRLRSDEELALHSRVRLGSAAGPIAHIPMIDFAGDAESSCAPCVAAAVSEFGIPSYQIFDSGRSFHLYGFALLDGGDWVSFMGRLLLLNVPGSPECVDSRWVGHRLLAGYASLRWTCRTAHYRSMPSAVAVQ